MGFPGSSAGKEFTCNAGDLGSMPGLGRSPGEGNGNPLYCSGLENPMDSGAWCSTVHRVAELDMTERLTHTHHPGSPFIRMCCAVLGQSCLDPVTLWTVAHQAPVSPALAGGFFITVSPGKSLIFPISSQLSFHIHLQLFYFL